MKIHFNLVLLLAIIILFASCEKYLDVKPKGVIIPEKTSDYEDLLKSPTITESFPSTILYLTDEQQGPYTKLENTSTANAYFWNRQLNNDVESNPVIWGHSYRSIYNTNVIINSVMNSSGSTDIKKKQIKGEALTIRAALYFDLLTVYAKAYQKSSASTDPGLPLVTSIDVTEASPQRLSLQATVDAIIADLRTAEQDLPSINSGRARITKYTAAALLARIYLYIQNYEEALIWADKALLAPHSLVDYNNYVIPVSEENPEVLWHRLPDDNIAVMYDLVYSQQLIDSFDPDDLRFQLLAMDFYGNGDYYWVGPDFGSFGITFPEIYLIKSEALARANQITKAMDLLNNLRIKRIASYAYNPLTASNQTEALSLIWKERSWELVFKGTRWMDMKRLDAIGAMPDVKRINRSNGQILETLPAKSPRYTFEIPSRVLMFNPNMTRNF